jgi:signal peptidase I
LERWADFLLTVVACGGLCLLLWMLLWMLLQVTSLASFCIPTESMQPTLIPGDYILVEKWTMGGRIFDLPDAAEGRRWIRMSFVGNVG